MKRNLILLMICAIVFASCPAVLAEEDILPQPEQEEISTAAPVEDTEALDKILKDSIALILDNEKGLMRGVRGQIDQGDPRVRPFEQNGMIYLPAEFAARGLGGKYEWYEKTKTAYLNYGHFVLQFDVDMPEYKINGKPYPAEYVAILKEDVAYLPVEFLEKGLNKFVYAGEGGVTVICDRPFSISEEQKRTFLNYIASEIAYDRPSGEQIYRDLIANNPNHQHPRIMITPEKPEQFKALMETDELYARWGKNIIAAADAGLTQECSTYTKPNNQLLGQSRAVLGLMQRLSMGYLLTGNQSYADRAWKEIENIASFPDWNPVHFLDVGEMSAAVAFAYDWMYDAFTAEQRAFIRNMLKVKAFYPALDAYRQTGPKLPSTQCQWIYSDVNWNAVCNGGIAMAALAVGDEEDITSEAIECLAGGVKSIENMLKSFAPDGAWFEGVGYWQYTIQYLVMYMSSLDTALGTDYGCFNLPGVKQTAYFPIYMMGPNAMFSYGDSGNSNVDVPEWNYFANKLGDAAIAGRRAEQLKRGGGSFKDMLWYNPDMYTEEVELPKDKYFGGIAQVATMRSSWDDKDALFFGVRAGKGAVNHGHADVGSFTFDANGINWAVDAGGDDYGLEEIFGWRRYEYYRLRAESHNMLVINPEYDVEIDLNTTTDIQLETKDRGGYVTLDMTKAYGKKGVESATRAMGLIENRTKFIVQDEVKTKEPSEMYWFMLTKADIQIAEDGKSALLEQNGQRLHAQILSPSEGTFTITEDKPLPTSPQHNGQKYIKEIQKLTIHLEEQTDTAISVVLTPLSPGQTEPATPSVFAPIAEWKIPDGSLPTLSSIKIDGETPAEFKPSKYSYTVSFDQPSDTAPVVEAEGEYEVKITQAEQIPGTAVIDLLENGESIKQYHINFNLAPQIGVIEGKTKLKPASVMASDTPEAVNLPENVLDNDLSTKWAAQGNQWLMFDLGRAVNIDTVAISWMSPEQRISPFEIEVSNDLKEWKQVYAGQSAGIKADFDNYSFTPVSAQYVRIQFHGSQGNTWNSIMEVGIYGE